MNRRSKWLWIEPITGSRKISNLFLLVSSFGFTRIFVVGISSYLGRNLIPLLPSQQILFVPQGIVMCFMGLQVSLLALICGALFCAMWVVAIISLMKKKELYAFFVGISGRNRRIFLQFLIKDIQAIKMEVQEGIFPRRVLYMEIKGQQDIPLTRTEENLTLREMEQKAAELARFLRVSIEGF